MTFETHHRRGSDRAAPIVLVATGAMLALALGWKIAVIDRLPVAAPAPPPVAQLPEPAVRDETVVAHGVIAGTLQESAARVGATPAVNEDVVRLFARRLDFQRDLRPGDRFRLIFFRTVRARGGVLAAGTLDYAELGGVKLYRFVRGDGRTAYLDGRGQESAGLLRTPVYGARITSLFGLREHPILGYTRAHQGVDFAAASGTPIQAAGDGVVAEAGPWGGYGNWLRLRHGGGWDTGYGHVSAYAPGIYPGVHVRQGQVVAYVGATGLATGPHLHYEVWKDGARVNPIGATSPPGPALAGPDIERFRVQKARVDALLTRTP